MSVSSLSTRSSTSGTLSGATTTTSTSTLSSSSLGTRSVTIQSSASPLPSSTPTSMSSRLSRTARGWNFILGMLDGVKAYRNSSSSSSSSHSSSSSSSSQGTGDILLSTPHVPSEYEMFLSLRRMGVPKSVIKGCQENGISVDILLDLVHKYGGHRSLQTYVSLERSGRYRITDDRDDIKAVFETLTKIYGSSKAQDLIDIFQPLLGSRNLDQLPSLLHFLKEKGMFHEDCADFRLNVDVLRCLLTRMDTISDAYEDITRQFSTAIQTFESIGQKITCLEDLEGMLRHLDEEGEHIITLKNASLVLSKAVQALKSIAGGPKDVTWSNISTILRDMRYAYGARIGINHLPLLICDETYQLGITHYENLLDCLRMLKNLGIRLEAIPSIMLPLKTCTGFSDYHKILTMLQDLGMNGLELEMAGLCVMQSCCTSTEAALDILFQFRELLQLLKLWAGEASLHPNMLDPLSKLAIFGSKKHSIHVAIGLYRAALRIKEVGLGGCSVSHDGEKIIFDRPWELSDLMARFLRITPRQGENRYPHPSLQNLGRLLQLLVDDGYDARDAFAWIPEGIGGTGILEGTPYIQTDEERGKLKARIDKMAKEAHAKVLFELTRYIPEIPEGRLILIADYATYGRRMITHMIQNSPSSPSSNMTSPDL